MGGRMRGRGMVVGLFVGALSLSVPSAGVAYEVVDVKGGGGIAGKVKFAGSPPGPKIVQVGQDREACGKTQEIYEIEGKQGGLKNAVVRIAEIKKGKKVDFPAAALDQKGCVFSPRVVLTPPGKLTVLNSDPVSHNVHMDPAKNDPVNTVLSKLKRKTSIALEFPEIIPVKCDQHGWMSAFVVVADHAYYALTGDDGSFALRDVPPGTYTLEVWHETLGTQRQKVTVEAGKNAAVELTYKK